VEQDHGENSDENHESVLSLAHYPSFEISGEKALLCHVFHAVFVQRHQTRSLIQEKVIGPVF
jgi:hypothetical protein